jgi:hypothetical protein
MAEVHANDAKGGYRGGGRSEQQLADDLGVTLKAVQKAKDRERKRRNNSAE